MRLYLSPLILLLCFIVTPLAAQQSSSDEVSMSSEEFKSLARKLAELRARKVAMYRRQQQQWQQYYAQQYAQRPQCDHAPVATAVPYRNRGADAGSRSQQQGRVDLNLESGDAIVYDTLITIDPDLKKTITVTPRLVENNLAYADNEEMRKLRDRLDEQERRLQDLQDRSDIDRKYRSDIVRDTTVKTLIRTTDPDNLTQNDLQQINNEMVRMREEIQRLRAEAELEERRRERAEDRMEDMMRYREGNDRYRNDRFGLDPYNNYNNGNQTLRPSNGLTFGNGTPGIIRDTIFVDRVGKPDTIMVVERNTVRDTVVKELVVPEEVVITKTVEILAKEPIGFPTIFFANNSATLDEVHRGIISTMIDEMRNKGNYNVRLTGYASALGNAEYNLKLSARRAEAVKQGLIAMGIPASRIRLVAGGIDYQPASPAAARRVEILAIPQ